VISGHYIRRSAMALACIMAVTLGACGAGRSNGVGESSRYFDNSGEGTHVRARRRGPLKQIKWGVWKAHGRSVKLFAFVPYCSDTRPEPSVEKIGKRRRGEGIVLSLFVRFPLKPPVGCLGVELAVLSPWIRLHRSVDKTPLYDGSTSPPLKRWPS